MQLPQIEYWPFTCYSCAAINHNAACLSLAWKRQAGGVWHVIWWVTDKSQCNNSRSTTVKTFYIFLHAAIFWWEGHFQRAVIATVGGSRLAASKIKGFTGWRWRGKEGAGGGLVLDITSFVFDNHCLPFNVCWRGVRQSEMLTEVCDNN